MRKLSEIKNEDALEILADIFDPITRICSDKEIRALAGKSKAAAVKAAVKNYKRDVLYVLARLDGEDPDKYEVNIIQIPVKIFELLNDPDMASFFTSQGLTDLNDASGSATVNTEATGIQ